MTKVAFAIAIGLASLSAPAFAQHNSQMASGTNDPCVLGTNAQPGTCVGPVRVAPSIMSQGSVQSQTRVMNTGPTHFAPAPHFGQPVQMMQPAAYAQPTLQAPSLPPQGPSSGCVPGYGMPTIGCNGYWVAAPNVAPSPVHYHAPAPQPVHVVQYAPAPQAVGYIPTSFFTGGITYGAGFPIDSYGYGGGGGFIISGGGGTRFSGVRERSPTALVPPAPRPRHNPPPTHRPPCCGH